MYNNVSSMTAGVRGPVLLEDYALIEKLAQFDRERIPERVVHARGATAKGFFEVTHDISHLTYADVFRAPGAQTEVLVRFSTVIHERGSPETLRDPRGFAVKFYTREGNWDLVGNNIPVFFIRDAMVFPDMVRSLKPNPVSHIQENWRILDFFSHHPESLNMVRLDTPPGPHLSPFTRSTSHYPNLVFIVSMDNSFIHPIVHVPDRRPGHSPQLPQDGRVRCPHVQADQQAGQGNAGQVPLEDQAGRRVPYGR